MEQRIGIVILCLIVILLFLAFGIYQYFRISQMLTRLEHMLYEAQNGRIDEENYDETRMSRLETGFYRFFSTSSLSKKKLIQEEERIKSLIGDISHQTKTPIANISLYADLLQEEELSQTARPLAEQIKTQADKLTFLIQALVKVSRLENGVVQVVPARVSVVSIVLECIEAVSEKAKKKDVVLFWKAENQEVFAWCDRKWTLEAIFNIVDNAIKYTKSGGRVELEVKRYPMFVRIDIKDDGPGIAEEEQPKIFLRFYRGNQVSQKEGVGIGLYLARQIITAEDGYIKVDSEVGKGSCFSVCLPGERE